MLLHHVAAPVWSGVAHIPTHPSFPSFPTASHAACALSCPSILSPLSCPIGKSTLGLSFPISVVTTAPALVASMPSIQSDTFLHPGRKIVSVVDHCGNRFAHTMNPKGKTKRKVEEEAKTRSRHRRSPCKCLLLTHSAARDAERSRKGDRHTKKHTHTKRKPTTSQYTLPWTLLSSISALLRSASSASSVSVLDSSTSSSPSSDSSCPCP
jgi:hypothetical protein